MSAPIVEYWIITEHGTSALVAKVNALIRDGWEPCGGICVVPGTIIATLVQSMIRRDVIQPVNSTVAV